MAVVGVVVTAATRALPALRLTFSQRFYDGCDAGLKDRLLRVIEHHTMP